MTEEHTARTNQSERGTEHVEGVDHCPVCGHDHAETVDTEIDGRGSTRTLAIKECAGCGVLWAEPREFFGVVNDA